MKHGSSEQSSGLPPTSSYLHSPSKEAQRPEKTVPTKVTPQKDWLTGDDDFDAPPTSMRRPSPEPAVAVVRDSPSKRASFIERSNIPIQEALAATHERLPSPPPKSAAPSAVPNSPSARAHRMFPELDTTVEPTQALTDNWSPVAAKNTSDRLRAPTLESSSSADEDEPEDADRYVPPQSTEVRSGRPQRKGRQSSVHDLVDLYGGGMQSKERDKVVETTRSNITQLPSRPVTGDYMDYVTDKRKSRASPAVPAVSRRKSVSPQPISTPAPEPSNQKPTSANSPTSPASSRSSRPQSMFVFPTKMTDTPAPLSASLSPPPETEPRIRGTRRTSINDMVQRYEAIDAVARSGAISAAPSRMARADSGTSSQNTAPGKRSIQPNGRMTASLSARDQTSSGLSKIPSGAAQHTSQTGLPRISPSLRAEPEKPKETEVITPRPRRISARPAEGSGSVSFPIQKSISSPMEETSKSSDARSPSPERPYQGVGRLIDQWQRKTTETESSRNPIIPKRGGFVAKRAGLVNGPSRGQ
ncbi:hypothetical protein MPER_12905 [Moniliophthora perniciosa FA553]|nr:hypothetical protein MPER_12905 [Moniliophthora perniciosa FA553]